MSAFKIVRAAIAAIALLSTFGAANATVVDGTFNEHGYDIVNIHVDATSTVDFSMTGGYGDPTIALFNGAGNHLVTNDDANGSLFSHLTQNLSSGNYSLLVTYCCNVVSALPDSIFASTDGFNGGSYWFGGSATLASVTSYLDQFNLLAGTPYQFTLTNAAIGTAEVPEPYTIALFGIALAALGLSRRKKQSHA